MRDFNINLIYENEISAEQLDSLFNGVKKWIGYWSLLHILYIICYDTFGLFLILSTLYFIFCCILLVRSFKKKSSTYYKKTFIFTLIYSLSIIIYDFVIMIMIIFYQDFYRETIGPPLLIDFPEHIENLSSEYDNGLDIFFLAAGITIIFIVVIITQIIFIKYLHNRIKFFDAYQNYIYRINNIQQYNPQVNNNMQYNPVNYNVATPYMPFNPQVNNMQNNTLV